MILTPFLPNPPLFAWVSIQTLLIKMRCRTVAMGIVASVSCKFSTGSSTKGILAHNQCRQSHPSEQRGWEDRGQGSWTLLIKMRCGTGIMGVVASVSFKFRTKSSTKGILAHIKCRQSHPSEQWVWGKMGAGLERMDSANASTP